MLRVEVHVHVDGPIHVHADGVQTHGGGLAALIKEGFAEVLRAVSNLRRSERLMNTKLTTVVGGLTDRVSGIDTTLGSVGAFVNGVPALVAAAVAKALADNDVDESDAADAVQGAFDDVSTHLQPIMDAIKAATPDADAETPTPEPDPLPTEDPAAEDEG